MTKGHVPESSLFKYRTLRTLAYKLESAAGQCSGYGDFEEANILFAMAKKYRDRAMEMRVDLIVPNGKQ